MFHADKMNGLKQHVNYSCRLLVKSISRIVSRRCKRYSSCIHRNDD